MSNKNMRTIKFRGKRLDNAQWAYGSLITTDRNIMIHIAHHEMFAVDPETIGQFTGLLDKNGNEIYEEDILQFEDESGNTQRREVWFCDDGFCVTGNAEEELLSILYVVEVFDAKIISNIHDNPELLTSNQDRYE